MKGKSKKTILLLFVTAFIVAAAGLLDSYDSHVYAAVKKPPRPKIKSITTSQKAVTIKTKRYRKVDGFQIKYSRNKRFSGSKYVRVRGKSLNKKIKLLRSSKRYYFKIRTYRVRKGKRVYSKWSKWKSARIPKTNFKGYYVYVKTPWVPLHRDMKESSKKVYAWYNKKLYLADQYVYKRGIWNQVVYKGRTYFLWTSKKTSRISKKKSTLSYRSDNVFEEQVIRKAMTVYNKWPTKYDYTHRAEKGVKNSSGKYPFDCSNFTAYVLNSVMQQYCPAFRLSSDDDEQYRGKVLVNEGLPGEVRTVTVCKGKPDKSKLRPGDLLFFGKNRSSSNPVDHVGMYLGKGEFIHSSPGYTRYPGDHAGGVNIVPLKGSYYKSFVVAKRVIPDSFTELDIPMQTVRRCYLYSASSCWSDEKTLKIAKGTPVSVRFTSNRRNEAGAATDYTRTAYIRYEDENGDTQFAFILFSNLTDPVEPEPTEPDPVEPDPEPENSIPSDTE